MKTFNELYEEFKELNESKGMLEDVEYLYKYTVGKKALKILELGVLHGNSTRTFACAASQIPGSHVTSVDIEQQCLDEVYQRLLTDGTENFVSFVNSDSVKFLWNQEDDYWDLIFIDTSHHLTQTIAELFLAAKKIKQKGGLIFMHDLGMKEVQQAIELFLKYMPKSKFLSLPTSAGLALITMGD